jgi:hypothetical protein
MSKSTSERELGIHEEKYHADSYWQGGHGGPGCWPGGFVAGRLRAYEEYVGRNPHKSIKLGIVFD